MRKLLLLPTVLLLLLSCKKNHVISPPPSSETRELHFSKAWGSGFGGTNMEEIWGSTATLDGGTVLIGYTESSDGDVTGFHGAIDVWILKLDKSGNKVWQTTIGGSGGDYGRAIVENSDGSLTGVGYSDSKDGDFKFPHGGMDAVVFHLDRNGHLLWQKQIGDGYDNYLSAMSPTADGSFVFSGYSKTASGDMDLWVVKTTANGEVLWHQTYGGSGNDYSYTLTASKDGGNVIGGQTTSRDGKIALNHGQSDVWIIKIDESGHLLWEKTYGGTASEWTHAVTATSDGGFMFVGQTSSTDGDMVGNHGGMDGYVIKIDGNGNKLWSKVLGGSANDLAEAILSSFDAGYYLTLNVQSRDGEFPASFGFVDAWLIKLDEQGNQLGEQPLGGPNTDHMLTMASLGTGSYVLAGSSNTSGMDRIGYNNNSYRDAWIVKFTDK
jgi:hypothetical protein